MWLGCYVALPIRMETGGHKQLAAPHSSVFRVFRFLYRESLWAGFTDTPVMLVLALSSFSSGF